MQKKAFRGFTEATAEVIMLPPEPPITSNPPDSDSRITGAMDDGGCSPTETVCLLIRLTRGQMATSSTASCWICRRDFTRPDGVCPLAEVRQLVVHDDARPRGIKGPSKTDKTQSGEQITHQWHQWIYTTPSRSHLVDGAGG